VQIFYRSLAVHLAARNVSTNLGQTTFINELEDLGVFVRQLRPPVSYGTAFGFRKRTAFKVFIANDEPLFGEVPMEMMDLVLHPDPGAQRLIVNPASPYIPDAFWK
jgi:hypothetical protein